MLLIVPIAVVACRNENGRLKILDSQTIQSTRNDMANTQMKQTFKCKDQSSVWKGTCIKQWSISQSFSPQFYSISFCSMIINKHIFHYDENVPVCLPNRMWLMLRIVLNSKRIRNQSKMKPPMNWWMRMRQQMRNPWTFRAMMTKVQNHSMMFCWEQMISVKQIESLMLIKMKVKFRLSLNFWGSWS